MDSKGKTEVQILKSIIENETSKERLLPHLSEKYFNNIGNQELLKLIKKHPEYSLQELSLQIQFVPNNEIRKEIQKSVIEVTGSTIIREEVLYETGEKFIKEAKCFEFLREASENHMNRKPFPYLDRAKEIEEFSLTSTKEHTKSLSEISSMDFEDYVWHCLEFIPVIEGKLTMVTGRGASGKGISMLRNALLYLTENKDRRVLLWNMDDSIQDIKIRIDVLKKNGLIIDRDIYDRLAVLDGSKDFKLEELKREFSEYDYVAIDPLSHLLDGEENDAAKVKPVMKFFQNICNDENKIIILVHHEAKGSDGRGSGHARGSSSFFDNVRLSYSMKYNNGKYLVETTKNNYGEFRESFDIDPWNTIIKKRMGEKLFNAFNTRNDENDEDGNSMCNGDWS